MALAAPDSGPSGTAERSEAVPLHRDTQHVLGGIRSVAGVAP